MRVWGIWSRAAIIAALAGSAGGAAWAQVVLDGADEPAEAERRTIEAVRQGSAAARGEPVPAERVTFEQVLADPDNLDLNYRFAQSQIAEGDLKGAMTTLERILLTRPELQRVRLLYAVVLVRLDNTDEAERELKALLTQPMPDSLRAEIEKTLADIDRRKRSTRYAATLTFGGQLNSNRDAAPDSNKRVAGGLTFVSPDGTADAALLAIASFELRHDLGAQAGHEYFLKASGYVAEQRKVDSQDLQAFFAETGFVYRTNFADFTPSLSYGHYLLRGEGYLDTYGAKLDIRRRLDDSWTVYAAGEIQHQDYDRVSTRVGGFAIAPLAHERSGERFEAEAGAIWRLAPQHLLRGNLALATKDANKAFNSYDYGRAELSHTWLLGQGMFLVSTASAALQDYKKADTRIAPQTREDVILLGRVVFGVPLVVWMPQVAGTGLGDMVMSVAAQVTHQDSNITNYTYTDVSGQLLFTKRWEF